MSPVGSDLLDPQAAEVPVVAHSSDDSLGSAKDESTPSVTKAGLPGVLLAPQISVSDNLVGGKRSRDRDSQKNSGKQGFHQSEPHHWHILKRFRQEQGAALTKPRDDGELARTNGAGRLARGGHRAFGK